ncbi:LysR family transcriptional regulator [Janthinobacterium agaricidamnosum]|uniref:Bacterial regulatory helix-turn-helix, lysR family protein n=1 Tax=Janthinobacterium agaricidamnosum NBRC 102515 = DSM 9628 TaxID=1349767 RepID=W0V855_9BURK|nr:LysR family transcriptional regulator [Janthinobacterium agaricidamnosum]CDG84994.1 bacterial regulatory helix-turn-helix, lysR family protein [Janthinobacterium agaricidamnosum NBRC 102515 = DSM 9628]
MNTRFLEAFVWAARLGSFRTAAEKLHITQAAISNRIASLEQDFGTRLFDRDTREIRLTFAGRKLLVHAERMLELCRDMYAASAAPSNVVGEVRIGAIETVVHTWLIPFLQRVQERYPGIEIQLTSESTRRLHEQLQQGELDIALQTDMLAGEHIRNTSSGAIAMGWVGCAAGWPDPDTVFSVAQLAERPIVTMNRGSQPDTALKALCQTEGVIPQRIHNVSSISAIVRLVKAGFGIAVLPLAPLRDEIDQGNIALIRCASQLRPQRIVISYSKDLTSDAIELVALLACEEAERFAQGLAGVYCPPP